MNFENMNIWCWLIPALVGIICGILGYLIGKGSTKVEDNSTEISNLKTSNSKLKADLDACNQKVIAASKIVKPAPSTPSKNLGASAASFAAGAATSNAIAFDASAAKAVFGKNIKQDDLKLVEGIGPKIEGMFKDHGIKTWKALSETSLAECQKILDTGGTRYKIHDPASWPMQSKMCYEGKWEELAKWQEEHKHGKL
jgi:predicted flap endonuclease-1-like 5' DNA nuclease